MLVLFIAGKKESLNVFFEEKLNKTIFIKLLTFFLLLRISFMDSFQKLISENECFFSATQGHQLLNALKLEIFFGDSKTNERRMFEFTAAFQL